jgi:hypothetical protein
LEKCYLKLKNSNFRKMGRELENGSRAGSTWLVTIGDRNQAVAKLESLQVQAWDAKRCDQERQQ